MKLAALVPLKYSPVNSAMGKDKGIHKRRARKEVISVPMIKGSAPYCSLSGLGFHSEENIKLKPYSFIVGSAPLIRVKTIPPMINRTIVPLTNNPIFNALSFILICSVEQFVAVFYLSALPSKVIVCKIAFAFSFAATGRGA